MGWTETGSSDRGSSTAIGSRGYRDVRRPRRSGAVRRTSVAGADLERLRRADADLDPAGLGLLGHRDGDGEDAGVVAGLEAVAVERLAERDLAGHRALGPLTYQDGGTLGRLPVALGADGEDVALDL